MIGYLEKAIRSLVLIKSKMSRYFQKFKVKDGDKDKNNKLMSFYKDYEKLLDKCKTIGTKIKDLKTIELNALSVYDDRYIKTKIRTHDANLYTNFCGLNVPKYAMECEYFSVISIDSLLVYESKYYVQVYLDNCAYKIANK